MTNQYAFLLGLITGLGFLIVTLFFLIKQGGVKNRKRTPVNSAPCLLPPIGWRCTRGAGHEGPCAAVPDDSDSRRGDQTQKPIISKLEISWRRFSGLYLDVSVNGSDLECIKSLTFKFKTESGYEWSSGCKDKVVCLRYKDSVIPLRYTIAIQTKRDYESDENDNELLRQWREPKNTLQIRIELNDGRIVSGEWNNFKILHRDVDYGEPELMLDTANSRIF